MTPLCPPVNGGKQKVLLPLTRGVGGAANGEKALATCSRIKRGLKRLGNCLNQDLLDWRIFRIKPGEEGLKQVPFGPVQPNISFPSELYRNRAFHQKGLKFKLHESIICN